MLYYYASKLININLTVARISFGSTQLTGFEGKPVTGSILCEGILEVAVSVVFSVRDGTAKGDAK